MLLLVQKGILPTVDHHVICRYARVHHAVTTADIHGMPYLVSQERVAGNVLVAAAYGYHDAHAEPGIGYPVPVWDDYHAPGVWIVDTLDKDEVIERSQAGEVRLYVGIAEWLHVRLVTVIARTIIATIIRTS